MSDRQSTTTALATRSESSAAIATAQPAGFVRLDTIQQAIDFANFIGKSALVPDAFRGKPGDIVIAMQLGIELGLAPLQSLQSIAVVNGRPTLWGDAMKGLVIGHPECEDFVEDEPQGADPTQWVATCTIKRRNRSAVVRTFSWADAQAAGLAGKGGPWKQYPKRMLMLRARGFALRDAFPDRLRGIITAEEAHDYPAPAPAVSEPRRVGQASTVPTSAVPPAETDPADDAAATPAAPAASNQASRPAAASTPSPTTIAPADQTADGVIVQNTSFARDKEGQALYEIQTSAGLFYTRNEEFYSALAVIEGTDHTATLTFRMARKGGKTANVLTGVTVDEVVVDEEGAGQ